MIAIVRFALRLWARVPRVLRVLVASGAATAADTAVLLLLCWGVGLSAGLAAGAGSVAGGAVNFAINRTFIFGGGAGDWWTQALRYGVIVVLGGAVISGVAVAALVATGLPLLVAKAAAVVLTLVVWTYPMSARVVFAGPAVAAH
jgi:putative flippase GtrA